MSDEKQTFRQVKLERIIETAYQDAFGVAANRKDYRLRHAELVAQIEKEFASDVEDAWKYRDLND